MQNSQRHEVVTLYNENYNVGNRGISSCEGSNSGIVSEYAESEEVSDYRDELDIEGDNHQPENENEFDDEINANVWIIVYYNSEYKNPLRLLDYQYTFFPVKS